MFLQRDTERDRRFVESPIRRGATPHLPRTSGCGWTPCEVEVFDRELEALLLRWRRREIPDDGSERVAVLAFARVFPAEP
ncbi:hypothetical protein [Glycomyces sp. YM15]|uniref:hypothetical protein n=1 Tax=Glycomyces sp. YM15 TaxID=2800446 RepID=UPI001963D6E8|nr:hypothetical protein [Glycomyces sp. YM15]